MELQKNDRETARFHLHFLAKKRRKYTNSLFFVPVEVQELHLRLNGPMPRRKRGEEDRERASGSMQQQQLKLKPNMLDKKIPLPSFQLALTKVHKCASSITGVPEKKTKNEARGRRRGRYPFCSYPLSFSCFPQKPHPFLSSSYSQLVSLELYSLTSGLFPPAPACFFIPWQEK